VVVVEFSNSPVGPGEFFGQETFKGVGDTELTVDGDQDSLALAQTERFDQARMTVESHGTQVMPMVLDGGRRDLLGKAPIAGRQEILDQTVWALSE